MAECRESRSYVFTLKEITQDRMRSTYAFFLDVHLTQFCIMAYGSMYVGCGEKALYQKSTKSNHVRTCRDALPQKKETKL